MLDEGRGRCGGRECRAGEAVNRRGLCRSRRRAPVSAAAVLPELLEALRREQLGWAWVGSDRLGLE